MSKIPANRTIDFKIIFRNIGAQGYTPVSYLTDLLNKANQVIIYWQYQVALMPTPIALYQDKNYFS